MGYKNTKAINALRQTGYKLTKPRQAILELLKKKKHPLTAAIIHKYLPHINLSSIYRTLNLLNKLNLIQKELINGISYYYLANSLHHHIICNHCGYSQCLPCHHNFKHITNFINIKHQLILTGTCKICASKIKTL